MTTTANRYDVSHQVVLVTGAGSGIGRSIAQAFLANGARVVVTGRRVEKLQETIADFGEDRALAIPTDVSKGSEVRDLIERTVSAFGRLDTIINNAGVHLAGDITEISDEDWQSLYATNVDALFHVMKYGLSHLAKTSGSITVVTSVSGIGGDWKQPAYNSTKYAINGLIQSVALDWGEQGVRINGIAPAFTKTPMTEGMGRDEESLQPFVDRLALGRVGEPDDLAGIALFLSTSDAQYITGQIIPVDGGTSASNGQPRR